MRQNIKEFNWDRAFIDFSINVKVSRFNKAIKNNMANLIPHDGIVCDVKKPRYINAEVYK